MSDTQVIDRPSAAIPSQAGDELTKAAARVRRRPPLASEIQRASRERFERVRASLYPAAGALGLALGGAALHDAQAHPATALIGAGVVAVAGLRLKKVREWLNMAAWRRNWATGCLGAATAWTSAATAWGVSWDNPLPALLVGGLAIGGAPWWNECNKPVTPPRRPDYEQAALPPSPPPPPAPEEPSEANHPHHKVWLPLSSPGGCLVQSYLSDMEQVYDHHGKPNGVAWTINLRPGRETARDATGAIELIHSAFNMDAVATRVFVESHPDGNNAKARLVVLERNPLVEGIKWEKPGLDLETGVAPISLYPDGSGLAPFKFFKPGSGPVHTQVTGTTDAGKSGTLRWIVIEALHAGMPVWLFDPQSGASFPGLQGFVNRTFYGPDQIKVGLRAAEAFMNYREKWLTSRGTGQFDFGRARKLGVPMAVMIFDEVPDVLADDRNNEIFAGLVRKARKTGIMLVLATQQASIDQYGDAGSIIRENVAGGNAIMHRQAQRTSGAMAYQGAENVEPHLLPAYFDPRTKLQSTGGLAYVMPGRELPSRVMFVPHDMENAPEESAFVKAAQAGIAPATPEYDAEQAILTAIEDAEEELAEEDDAAPRSRRRRRSAPRLRPVPSYRDEEEEEGSSEELATVREQILDFVSGSGGRASTEDLVGAIDASPSWLYKSLARLVDEGQLEKPSRGVYAIPSARAGAS